MANGLGRLRCSPFAAAEIASTPRKRPVIPLWVGGAEGSSNYIGIASVSAGVSAAA